MLQGSYKPLLVVILIENFVLNEGRTEYYRELSNECSKLNEFIRNKFSKSEKYGEYTQNTKNKILQVSCGRDHNSNILSNTVADFVPSRLERKSEGCHSNYKGIHGKMNREFQGEDICLHDHDLNSIRMRNFQLRNRQPSATQNGKQSGGHNNVKLRMFVLEPTQVNENNIREIIGSKKIKEVPQCTKLQYETKEKWDNLSAIKGGEVNKIPRSSFEINPACSKSKLKNPISVRKMRSKWRLNIHEAPPNYGQTHYFYKEKPLHPIYIKKDEVGYNNNEAEPKISVYYTKTHDEGPEENLAIRQNTPPANAEYNVTGENNTPGTLSFDSYGDHRFQQPNQVSKEIKEGPAMNLQGNSYEEPKKIDSAQNIVKNVSNQNTDLPSRFGNDNKQHSMPNGEKKYSNAVLNIVTNSINKPLERNSSSLEASTSHRMHNITHNMVEGASNQLIHTNPIDIIHKHLKNSSNVNDSLQGSSSIVYVQGVPLKVPYGFNETLDILGQTQQKKEDDAITISINPKTLESKILHAKFLKMSEERKTPDTLNIELSRLDNSTVIEHNNAAVQRKGLLNLPMATNNQTINTTQGTESIQKSGNSNLEGGSIGIPLSGHFLKSGNSHLPQHILTNNESFKEGNSRERIISNNKNHASKIIKRNDNKLIRNVRSLKEIKSFYITKNGETMGKADDISNALISRIKEDIESNEDKNLALQNGLTKVIVIQTKQKEVCPSELGCEPTPKEAQCSDSKCTKTTLCWENFKELNEGYREDGLDEFKDLYKENPKWVKECSSLPSPPLYSCPNAISTGNTPCDHQKDSLHELETKELLHFSNPTSNIHESKRDTKKKGANGFPLNEEVVNFREETNFNYEKGNKKIENKILEGFISSIIANYSKEEVNASTQDPTENNEKTEEVEALVGLINDFTNKKNSEKRNIGPIIIPESSVSQFKNNTEYSKLGPFNEAEIMSLLRKNTMQQYEKQKNKR